MRTTNDINIKLTTPIHTGYAAVVQKGNMGSKYIYAEQLRNNAQEIHILRGSKAKVMTPVLTLKQKAGGHSQTWEYSGRSGKWFVGTKPKAHKYGDESIYWDIQVARVDINKLGKTYTSNTQLPRLAHLNRAGKNKYSGDKLVRTEAALSPDYSKFLIATVDDKDMGYFTIYHADVINEAFDKVEGRHGYVALDNIPYIKSYTFDTKKIGSLQGYDLDNEGNVYISSQKAPSYHRNHAKPWQTYSKYIYKLPFANPDDVLKINIEENAGPINVKGMHTELEGLQVLGENHCYLTVAYHKAVNGKNKTVANKLYEVSWNE